MDRASIARLVSLIVMTLAYFGVNVPEDWEQIAVGAIFLITVLWGFFKHNVFGKNGKELLELLKTYGKDDQK